MPFKGKSRFDKGAVEDASIYIPGVAGGKIRRGSGGNYGYFSEALDPSGKVVFRVGHGNVDRPEAETEILVAAGQPQVAATTGSTNTTDPQENLKRYIQDNLQSTLMQQLLAPQQQTDHRAVMEQMMKSMGGLGILQNPMSV